MLILSRMKTGLLQKLQDSLARERSIVDVVLDDIDLKIWQKAGSFCLRKKIDVMLNNDTFCNNKNEMCWKKDRAFICKLGNFKLIKIVLLIINQTNFKMKFWSLKLFAL